MTLNMFQALSPRSPLQQLRRDRSGSSSATSALAGGCWRGTFRRSVLARTAQRDDVDEHEPQRVTQNPAGAPAAVADGSTIPRTSEAHTSPLSVQNRKHLPNLSCSSPDATSCFNIRGIADPCLDDSLDLKIFQYMVELVRSGTTEERAAEVISQWSGGGGVEAVDIRKLRSHFMMTTMAEVARQHAAPAVLPVALTCLSYWSLGLLPEADEAVLPPAVRGALVAANLLLLVYFASRSLKRAGRVVRVGRAAIDFSGQAELVLLAMRDLAAGHGALIQAALGPPAAAATTGTAAAARGAVVPPAGAASSGIAAAAVAAQRHASRRLVLDASAAAMRHVKRQAAAAAAAAAATFAAATAAAAASSSVAAPSPAPLSDVSAEPADELSPSSASSSSASSSSASSSSASSPESTWEVGAVPCPPTPPPSPAATPLSSLDSYFVLREAATLSGGFDAVSELGMTTEEAAAAAAMYAKYGDSSKGGRIGDYELGRLLQDAGFPQPLSQEERRLALLLHSREGPEAGAPVAAGRGRGKGWLTFAEWAAWWAATPLEEEEEEEEEQEGRRRQEGNRL